MSNKEANNNLRLRPVKVQKSGLYIWTEAQNQVLSVCGVTGKTYLTEFLV